MRPIAVVSGGSRGIGYAIAQELAATHRLALLARTSAAAGNAAQSLPGTGHLGIACDVTDAEQIASTVSKIRAEFGGDASVLVNAAGVAQSGLLLRTSEEKITNVLHTNLLGPMMLSKALLKGMLRHKHGAILSIGSVLGATGLQGEVVYSASKAGLLGFTKSLSKEVAPKGIRVNLLVPGYVSTDMTKGKEVDTSAIPAGRMATPEEIARIAMFLLSEDAAYVTGQMLVADGGLT